MHELFNGDTTVTLAQFTHAYVQEHGQLTVDSMLSFSGSYSVIKPLLVLFSLTYAISVPLIGFIWAITRPSDWTYKYLWAFFNVNLMQMLFGAGLGGNDKYTDLRLQHIDEYGKDLRVFWPRVWYYTLPFNLILMLVGFMP